MSNRNRRKNARNGATRAHPAYTSQQLSRMLDADRAHFVDAPPLPDPAVD